MTQGTPEQPSDASTDPSIEASSGVQGSPAPGWNGLAEAGAEETIRRPRPDFEGHQQPYGQNPYAQPHQGGNPYSQDPYGQAPYGQAPYGQSPYGGQQAPFGQSPYGQQPPYGQAPSGQAPYQPPYGTTPFGQQPGGPPAQAGYPEQFPPARATSAQPPLSDSDARLWSTLAHLLIPVTGFVGPLLIWALLRDRSRLVAANATEALNFAILYSIAQLLSGLLTLVVIGYVLAPAVLVVGVVFAVMGAVAANRGEEYRYPLNWRVVDR